MNTLCHLCCGIIFDKEVWEVNLNVAGKRCRIVRNASDLEALREALIWRKWQSVTEEERIACTRKFFRGVY